jgi:hypothetical protein
MSTVADLIAALDGVDPDLPVGVLAVEREDGAERVGARAFDLVGVDVRQHRRTGRAQAVWVTASTIGERSPDVLCQLVPSTVRVTRDPCGCGLYVPVRDGRTFSLAALACDHHVPDPAVVASACAHGQFG